MKKYKNNGTKLLVLIITFVIVYFSLISISNAVIVEGKEWIVASRHPEATKVGALILQQGGNAFDAVVAVLAALGVVDPSMSGLGAEVFILFYSIEEKKVISINGGGTAPKAATIDWYVRNGGIPSNSSLLRGLIPGAFDAWITTLDKWGTMRLKNVLAPAIDLAESWVVSENVEKILTNKGIKRKLFNFPSSKEIYYKKDGSPYLSGEIMVNKDLANTMKRLVAIEQEATVDCPCRGDNTRHQALHFARDYFYTSTIAKEFADFCKANVGLFTYFDMASYHALIEKPAHINYRGYDVYTCSSANQGPAELEALNIIEKFNLTSLGHNTNQSIHLMAEAINLAYADREKYLGDFNFMQVPLSGLLSKEYAEKRKALINLSKRRTEWPYGDPFPFDQPEYIYYGKPLPRYPDLPPVSIMYSKAFCPDVSKVVSIPKDILIKSTKDVDESILEYENSYACAADKWGNLVYATSSLNSPFGTGVVIKPLGFLLNSGGERFCLEPDHANTLTPGKRPRNTITPTIVCKDGKPYLAFGASNGDGEPQTLVQTLTNIIDYEMDIQEAIDAPMWRSYCLPASSAPFTANPGELTIDKRILHERIKQLEEMGWKVTIGKEFCNNPDCIIMIDQEQGTSKVAVTSNKANTLIAR